MSSILSSKLKRLQDKQKEKSKSKPCSKLNKIKVLMKDQLEWDHQRKAVSKKAQIQKVVLKKAKRMDKTVIK